MEYNYEDIGKRIAKERKAYCHLSQDNLLLKLSENYGIGMNRNTLSAIENGKYHNYSIDFLFALCELFDCEMGYLLCEYNEKHRIVADVRDATGLEPDVINIILNMKYSFIKLSILNELLKDDYFLAIIDLLHIADYHRQKGRELNKLENKVEFDYKNDETLEEKEKFGRRHNDYRFEHKLHDANVLANRYRLTVAFSRLLDKRYEALPDIDITDSESNRKPNPKFKSPILF